MIKHVNSPYKLGFFDNLLRIDDSAHVVAASWANDMRWHRGAALRAYRKVSSLQTVVCTTLVGTRIRVFSFWNSHVSVLVNFVKGLIRLRFTALRTAEVTRLGRSLQPVIAISCPNSKQNHKKLANNWILQCPSPCGCPTGSLFNGHWTSQSAFYYFCLASFALRRSSMMSS